MLKKLPLARPLMGAQEERAVRNVLRSRWLVQGPRVAEFEESIRRYARAGHAVAVSSCTSALHLCYHALGMGPLDDVLVPAFTFVATANSVVEAGANPVFADVDLETFNLSPAAVEATIERHYRRRGGRLRHRQTGRSLRLIVAVHQFGLAADLGALRGIARRFGLRILEDAACALGTTYGSTHVGLSSVAACLSFHPRKSITTGEGGMVITRDAGLARKVRMLRDHGSALSDHARHAQGVMSLPEFPVSGFNARMTDLQGAIGVEQMKRLPAMLRRRASLVGQYLRRLKGWSRIALPEVRRPSRHTWQSFVIRFPGDPERCERTARALGDLGIATRPGTHAVPWLGAYAERAAAYRPNCPKSREAERTSMALPLFPEMKVGDVDRVCRALRASAD
jgi:dTDP-4-amino-4,6-dideoxygalactose transaminase